MASLFQNLSVTAIPTVNYAYDIVSGYAIRTLSNKMDEIINGKRQVRFYYRRDNRSFFQVLVDSALQYASTELKNAMYKAVRDKFQKQRREEYVNLVKDRRKTKLVSSGNLQIRNYGVMTVPIVDEKNKFGTIECKDTYGNSCSDGLMLKIPTNYNVKYTRYQNYVSHYDTVSVSVGNNKDIESTFESKYLVWSDATSMITFQSNKNTIITPVVGRDYSRKELASNGDIKFSVSGHILSGMAEVFPTEQVQKFTQIMQYKGLIEINNILLDQFGIEKILVLDFSITPLEGTKSQVDYSFNAIGIQPRHEIEITDDTLYLDDIIFNMQTSDKEDAWTKWFNAKAEGTAYSVIEVLDTGINAAINKIHI